MSLYLYGHSLVSVYVRFSKYFRENFRGNRKTAIMPLGGQNCGCESGFCGGSGACRQILVGNDDLPRHAIDPDHVHGRPMVTVHEPTPKDHVHRFTPGSHVSFLAFDAVRKTVVRACFSALDIPIRGGDLHGLLFRNDLLGVCGFVFHHDSTGIICP